MTEQQNKRLRLVIKNLIENCDQYESATLKKFLFQIDNIQVQIICTNNKDNFINKDETIFLHQKPLSNESYRV